MNESLQFYNENGYYLAKNFFNENEIKEILTDSKKVFFNQFLEKKYIGENELSEDEFNNCLYKLFEDDLLCLSNCGKQIQHLISLHRLSLSEKLIEQLNILNIKSPIISTRPVLYFNHPKLAKQKVFYKVDAHQDWRSMQGSLNSIVVWVPLVDIDKNLGALQVLPKSHLMGLRTDHIDNGFGMVNLNNKEKENLIDVEINVGDALFFSSFLIHQSGENITNKPRWSCHFRYNDLEENSFIQRKYAHPYIYKPIEELLTPNFPDINMIFENFK